jgi:hypothetical protein
MTPAFYTQAAVLPKITQMTAMKEEPEKSRLHNPAALFPLYHHFYTF